MSYYYPMSAQLPSGLPSQMPSQMPSTSPTNSMEKSSLYGGPGGPSLAGHVAGYPQPNAAVVAPGLMRPSPPLASGMPTYVPTTAAPRYPSAMYANPGVQAAPASLYGSTSLAYQVQPHMAGQSSGGAQLQTSPYIGAAVPNRYQATTISPYNAPHMITTSTGPSPYAQSTVYRAPLSHTVTSPTGYPPSMYAPSAAPSGMSHLQGHLTNIPGMNPSGGPLIPGNPTYNPVQPGAPPPYTPRM